MIIGNKKLVIDNDTITFLNYNKKFQLIDIDKYKNYLKGSLKIILLNNRLETIVTNINDYINIEKLINENFYNPKDKLFHYVVNKKTNNMILYSIDKPMILDNIMDYGKIISVEPYEFLLLKKYKAKKKSAKSIVLHVDFNKIFILAIENNQIINCRNVDVDDKDNVNKFIEEMRLKIRNTENDVVNLNYGNVDKKFLSKTISI